MKLRPWLLLPAALVPAQAQNPLVWSTLLGGTGSEQPALGGIATLSDGRTLVWGSTTSTDFPLQGGVQGSYGGGSSDGFVAVLDRLGTGSSQVVWSTYLGGSGSDGIRDVAVDAAGLVVCGFTTSADFPTTSACVQAARSGGTDMFVARLQWNGTALALVWSTYLGGTGNEAAEAVEFDGAGAVFVAGTTDSTDFPLAGNPWRSANAGSFDGVLACIDASGSRLVAATYLGGSGVDSVARMSLVAGGVVVAGTTSSSDFPTSLGALQTTVAGANDAFVCRFDPALDRQPWSTCLGGSGVEMLQAMTTTPAGEIVVGGWTGATSGRQYPVTSGPGFAGGIWDGFVSLLDPTASGPAQLRWSRLYGGTGDEGIASVAFYWLDFDVQATPFHGLVIAVGSTNSTDLPTTAAAFQPGAIGGSYDAFVAGFVPGAAPGGELLHASYLGGPARDEAFAVAVTDPLVREVAIAGVTQSAAFPTTPGCLSSTLRGPHDVFVTRLAMPAAVPGSVQSLASGCGTPLWTMGLPMIGQTLHSSFLMSGQTPNPAMAWFAIDLGGHMAWNGAPVPQPLWPLLPVLRSCQQLVGIDMLMAASLQAGGFFPPWDVGASIRLDVPFLPALAGLRFGLQGVGVLDQGVFVSDAAMFTIGMP